MTTPAPQTHTMPITRRVDPAALIVGEPFVALRVGPVYDSGGEELPGNVTDVSQLHEMVAHFERAQQPSGDLPLLDFDHAAIGPMSIVAHPERSIPLGAIVAMRVEGDGLLVTPAWTKRGREIIDAGEGLLHPSATYRLGDMHDRATGERTAGAALLAVAVTPMPATRPDQLGAVRAIAGAPVGLGVAYRLAPDVAATWPTIEGADPPDRAPHVTVAYMRVAPAMAGGIKAIMRAIIGALPAFRLTITGGVHAFHADDQGRVPVVAAVQSEGALAAHEAIMGAVREAGLPIEETHPGYVPHATIGYVRGDYTPPELVVSDLTVDTLEIWHGDGDPEVVRMNQAPNGAAQRAAGAAGGMPMSIEELLAALQALSPEDKAKMKAALGGGEEAAVEPTGEPAAVRAEAPVPEDAASAATERSVADLQAWRRKVEAEQAEAQVRSAFAALVRRGAALPAEEPVYRLAHQAGGPALASFTSRPDGQVHSLGAIGRSAGAALPATPPADRNGFALFVQRSAGKDESFNDALVRIRKAYPAQSRAAFGDRGTVDDSPLQEVIR